MINFIHAITFYNTEPTFFHVSNDSFILTQNKEMQFSYHYDGTGNNGNVICTFKNGIYVGKYNEHFYGEYYEGIVRYIITEDNNKYYLHGEWESTTIPGLNGYDFIIGLKLS